jgi:hypothetical protein
VNVPPSDALWLYRWSHPVAPYEAPLVVVDENSTSIIVEYAAPIPDLPDASTYGEAAH